MLPATARASTSSRLPALAASRSGIFDDANDNKALLSPVKASRVSWSLMAATLIGADVTLTLIWKGEEHDK